MPEMHLKQPGFTYSACGWFARNKERIEKFMQTGTIDYIYKNDLNKDCFQHDLAYRKYKDLNKRTKSSEVLRDKGYEIASNPKYDGSQRGSASIVFQGSGVTTLGNKFAIKSMPSQQLANELHKPFIKKFKRRSVYSSFKDNIGVLI